MSIFSQFKCVLVLSELDPAIDEQTMFPTDESGNAIPNTNGMKYLATRDEQFIKTHEGKEPVWFVLKPVKAKMLNAMVADLARPTMNELWSLTQHCLIAIENSSFVLDLKDFKTIGTGEEKRLTDDAMERIAEQWNVNSIRELGQALLVRARLPKEKLTNFLSQAG